MKPVYGIVSVAIVVISIINIISLLTCVMYCYRTDLAPSSFLRPVLLLAALKCPARQQSTMLHITHHLILLHDFQSLAGFVHVLYYCSNSTRLFFFSYALVICIVFYFYSESDILFEVHYYAYWWLPSTMKESCQLVLKALALYSEHRTAHTALSPPQLTKWCCHNVRTMLWFVMQTYWTMLWKQIVQRCHRANV